MFFPYVESARLPILYFMCRKRKAHKQTVRSSLCASNSDLASTAPTAEAAPILYSHKAEPGTANDKHGSSLLSITESSGLLLYFSLKSPFAQPFSIAMELLDRGRNVEYVLRDTNASPSGTASVSDRVFPLSLAVYMQQLQAKRRADTL